MDYFAGLDVSVKETSVCVVDDTGKIVQEVKVASEPDALLAVPNRPIREADIAEAKLLRRFEDSARRRISQLPAVFFVWNSM